MNRLPEVKEFINEDIPFLYPSKLFSNYSILGFESILKYLNYGMQFNWEEQFYFDHGVEFLPTSNSGGRLNGPAPFP